MIPVILANVLKSRGWIVVRGSHVGNVAVGVWSLMCTPRDGTSTVEVRKFVSHSKLGKWKVYAERPADFIDAGLGMVWSRGYDVTGFDGGFTQTLGDKTRERYAKKASDISDL